MSEKQYRKAYEAYSEAAVVAQKNGSDLNIALYYKQAADALDLEGNSSSTDIIVDLYEKTAVFYQRAGKFTDSARAYLKCSTFTNDDKKRTQLIEKAMELFE